MLVLTRKRGQSIVIPSLGITLTVLRVDGPQVRLGIEAPREVRIYRQEAPGARDEGLGAREESVPAPSSLAPGPSSLAPPENS